MTRLLLACCLLFAWTLPTAAQTPEEKEHIALRKLKDDISAAINKRDFDAVKKVMHEPFMATLITQESFTDVKGLKTYYEQLLTRANPRIKDMSIVPEADELSWIMTGTFAMTRGSTAERYELADGRSFDMKGRWTAVSVRQPDGSWKVLGVHTGVNFLDNPVINAIEQGLIWFSAAAGVVGLLLGGALGWLLKGLRVRRSAEAAAAR